MTDPKTTLTPEAMQDLWDFVIDDLQNSGIDTTDIVGMTLHLNPTVNQDGSLDATYTITRRPE